MKPSTKDLVRALLPIVQAAHLRNATRAALRARVVGERSAPATLSAYFEQRRKERS